jgi:hypothetical protein
MAAMPGEPHIRAVYPDEAPAHGGPTRVLGSARVTPERVWIRWLTGVSLGVVLFGLVLVLAPVLTLRAFSLMLYADGGRLEAMGREAAQYMALSHAVLGAVMIGWGGTLVALVRSLLARGMRLGWQVVTGSLLAWFVPDTSYSLLSGHWPNAVLNVGFALLFAVPLAATRRSCQGT